MDMATMIAAGCPVCGGEQFEGQHRPVCHAGHDEFAYKDACYAWQVEALDLRARVESLTRDLAAERERVTILTAARDGARGRAEMAKSALTSARADLAAACQDVEQERGRRQGLEVLYSDLVDAICQSAPITTPSEATPREALDCILADLARERERADRAERDRDKLRDRLHHKDPDWQVVAVHRESWPDNARLVEAWQTDQEIVVIGDPDAEDEEHNCDALGCGTLSHVLFRVPLDAMDRLATLEAEARGLRRRMAVVEAGVVPHAPIDRHGWFLDFDRADEPVRAVMKNRSAHPDWPDTGCWPTEAEAVDAAYKVLRAAGLLPGEGE